MELKRNPSIVLVNEITLLIVPYGIETGKVSSVESVRLTFNRTLWN